VLLDSLLDQSRGDIRDSPKPSWVAKGPRLGLAAMKR